MRTRLMKAGVASVTVRAPVLAVQHNHRGRAKPTIDSARATQARKATRNYLPPRPDTQLSGRASRQVARHRAEPNAEINTEPQSRSVR
jgi:hypothetical protein